MITYPDQPDTDPFKDDLDINNTLYVLRQPYTYVTQAKYTITIPEGFKTDETSVPRGMWTIVGVLPDGYYRCAAVIHDYLYSTGGLNGVFVRKDCDKILLELLTLQDVPYIQRKALYLAVRLFGGPHWKEKTE